MKNLEISFLMDFYGDLLTEKQRDAIERYYNEDLSLAEIAAHQGISRQGVRDSIKRAESLMFEMEDKLGLANKFKIIHLGLDKILNQVNTIEAMNNRLSISTEINKSVLYIRQTIKNLYELY